MKRQPLPSTDLVVSSFCYGVMRFGTSVKGPAMFELYQRYCEAGGNLFDTAHCYASWLPSGEGASERGLGECVRHFGNRRDVVISTKGGHPAFGAAYPRPADCLTPEVLASDITTSLERLQIDTIDLYTLHRDDTRHPASEIIDTLNAEIAKGRVRYIGASNWTVERLIEANSYASRKKLHGFVASSPQWNLVRPNHAPIAWDGSYDQTTHMMSESDIAWHRASGLAVMPWTPTAYGYIAGATGRNAESFDNPVSRKRRERAGHLAQELGCTANQVALAWLRAHEFPVFPILGTTDLQHLLDSIGADDISLTPEQRDWLTRET